MKSGAELVGANKIRIAQIEFKVTHLFYVLILYFITNFNENHLNYGFQI